MIVICKFFFLKWFNENLVSILSLYSSLPARNDILPDRNGENSAIHARNAVNSSMPARNGRNGKCLLGMLGMMRAPLRNVGMGVLQKVVVHTRNFQHGRKEKSLHETAK